MRILVFSDTHNNTSRAMRVINNIVGVDAVIHCGDVLADAYELQENFPRMKFYCVSGNCDMNNTKYEELIEIGGKKIFVTHGHTYNVKSEEETEYPTIKERGKSLGADAVVFGHTHVPYNRNWGDIVVMNPGSIKYEGTYGVIEIENNVLKSAICNIF